MITRKRYTGTLTFSERGRSTVEKRSRKGYPSIGQNKHTQRQRHTYRQTDYNRETEVDKQRQNERETERDRAYETRSAGGIKTHVYTRARNI